MIGPEEAVIVSLHDARSCDTTALGTKAATLKHLTAQGFAVPEGFVITTTACDRILAAIRGREHRVVAADLPPDVWHEVCTHLDRLGNPPVAVRSSGSAEDLPDASYAGQYETVLDVTGRDAVAEAIGRCLASASSEQVRAYRGSAARSPMAVLVQRMVPADAAGVAFTANPVTGDREVVVSAVKGLGDRLVSGEATPEDWVVREEDVSCPGAPSDLLHLAQVHQIATLAKKIEDLRGAPQDVEWALADGRLFVLQARPITALPVAPEIHPPTKGFWQKDTSHFPTPLTPFGASVYLPVLPAAFRPAAEEVGLLIEVLEFRSMGGEAYLWAVPLGGKDRPAPPTWVLWLAARGVPQLRRRARAAQSAIASGLPVRLLDRWEGEWRPGFADEIGELRRVDLAGLDDEALLAQLDCRTDLLRRGLHLHYRLGLPHALAIAELSAVCRELLGWEALRTLSLLTGASGTSSEPGRELQALAARIAADPAAAGAMTSGADSIPRLRQCAPWAAEAFGQYLDRYCHRTVGHDPGDPTLFERPELVAALLAEQLPDGTAAPVPTPVQQDARDEARAALAGRSAQDRTRFESALTFARRAYGNREDNIFWLDNQPCALLRYCAVEIGRRLTDRDVLARAIDAVFLEERELRTALTAVAVTDLRPLAAHRKAERAWVIAHPGPSCYGTDPGSPDLAPFPESLRLVNAAVVDLLQKVFTPSRSHHSAGELRGVPASPGRCSGTVRVVRDETEFSKLRPGDVLVCPTTTPAWSVLFLRARAVVTDGGGVLSHTAIVAREYGIPAVLATGEATRRLHDGDLVSVDGSTGIVTIGAAARPA